MTRTIARIALIAVFCFIRNCPGQAVGNSSQAATGSGNQITCPDSAPKKNKSFCSKDPRAEITEFCDRLAELLSYAQANPKVNPKCFEPRLDDLDLKNKKTSPSLIGAVALRSATIAATSSALSAAGQQRLDQQRGADTNASGTTTLVSKAGSAELLSLALDSGAVTQTVNGTTSTISANADELFRVITGNQPDCTVTCNGGWFENKILNQTNISASFALAQSSTTATPTSGQASGATPVQVSSASVPSGTGRLSAITARFQVMNKFDPRSDKFKAAWKAQVTSLTAQAIAVSADTKAVIDALYSHPTFTPSAKADASQRAVLLEAAKKDPSGTLLKQEFETYWKQVVTDDALQDPKAGGAIAKAVRDRAVYRDAWFNALDNAVGNLFTLQYSFNKPLNQPQTDDLKIIYAYNFKTTGMITFNGAVSFYQGALPPGAKYGQVHYGQVSAEYDRALSGKTGSLQTQLSLAGYWQYQPQPSILDIPAGTVAPGTNIPLPNGTQEFVGTAGSLYVTQAKLTIKGANGVNIPLGVSWSNKTDLLQGNKVGAQIGISYNFSSLAGLFTGGGQ